MASLRLSDLIVLSRTNDEERKLDINSREVMTDPQSRERLIEEGMIEPGGAVTGKGMDAIKAIRKREAILKIGIPFSERKSSETPKRLCRETTEPWFFAMVGKTQIVTNGEMLFIGTPEPMMNATRNRDLQQDLPQIIHKCALGNPVELWPHSYQSSSLGGVELIWLADKDQKLMIPVQSKYLDYVVNRFKGATFWGKISDGPVQVKSKGKGTEKNVVAIIQSYDISNQLEIPKAIKGWWNEMSKQELPVMGEDGSTLRKGEEE